MRWLVVLDHSPIPYTWWLVYIIEGSLEVKLPTIWIDEKRWEESEKRREEERERVRRKKIQVRGKVGKSRNTVFFQLFGAPESRKVGSLKRRVRSQLARWEIKNCTPLWRETHFQVKMCKTPQLRSPFISCDVEKVHAVVARSTCRSQNVQNTTCSDHFWKLRCRKSAREAHFQVNMCKTPRLRSIFRSCDVEKVHGAKTTLKSKVQKTAGFGAFLDVQMSFRVAGARDCAPGQKWAKRGGWWFCSISKNDGSCGTFEQDLQRCILRGRRSTRDIFIRAVRRSGRWFPESGCILEHRIFSFGKMILRDRSGAALRMTWHHFFVAGTAL